MPAPARTATVVGSDHRDGSGASSPTPERNDGRVTKKSTSSTPAQMKLSVRPWASAGAWNACASVGTERITAASVASVAIIRARGESNRCVPLRIPPTRNAMPSTSTLFAMIEPISAVCTTRTSPSCSANSEMKSSGMLPSADWTTPAADDPTRPPSCSVAPPTR